jgi:hypothetical protein
VRASDTRLYSRRLTFVSMTSRASSSAKKFDNSSRTIIPSHFDWLGFPSILLSQATIGLAPQEIFSPGVTVDDDFIWSPSFSIPIEGKGWLVLENSWLETPNDFVDYYQISVSSSRKPKDITVGSAEHIGEALNFPVSSISLGLASPIKRITIHQEAWSNSECVESVVYDRAIIFHRADGLMFSISAHDSIADLLDFTKTRDKVQEFVDNCKCRLTIE